MMNNLRKFLYFLAVFLLPSFVQADWQAVQDIGIGGLTNPSNELAIAVDQDGTTVGVRSFAGSVDGVVRPFNGVWSAPVFLGLIGADVEVAVDQSGNALALWRDGLMIKAATYTAQTNTWNTIGPIDTGTVSVSLPKIAMSPNGEVIAAWAKDDGVALKVVRYATAPSFNGILSIANLYTPNAATIQSIDVSISDLGEGLIGWIESPTFVRVANVPVPPGVPLITDLATGPNTVQDISVAMAAGAGAVAIWTDVTATFIDSAIYNGSWGLTGFIVGSVNGSTPDVAMDDAGNVVAVWLQAATFDIYGARFLFNAAGWQATSIISAVAFNASNPQVAIDGDGNAVVAWNQLTAATSGVVQARTLPFGSLTWGPVTNLSISSANATINANTVKIAINDAGNAIVGWIRQISVGLIDTAQTSANNILSIDSTIDATSTIVIADGVSSSVITVTVVDGNGVAIPGDNIVLTKNSLNATIAPASTIITNVDGQVQFTVKDATPETVTFTATDKQTSIVIGSVDVTFIAPTDPNPPKSTVIANPTVVEANGIDTSTITVTLRDSGGNLLSGRTVQLTQDFGSSSVITPTTAVTNADGVAVFTVRNDDVEDVTYTATDITIPADPVVLTQQPVVSFIEPVTVAGNSSVVANPTSVQADDIAFSTITVTLRNANNIPVSGHMVELTQSAGGNSEITTIVGVTNADGQATFEVRDSVVENVTYTARDLTSGVTVTQKAVVSFTALIVDPTKSTIVANPTFAFADGIDFSKVTVTLLNANGVPISGHNVSLGQGAGSSSISPLIGTTDSNGQVVFTVRDLTSETVTYTAKDLTSGIEITSTAQVEFLTRVTDAFVSTVNANPTSVMADGISTSTITVRLKNINGAPVVGHNVSLVANSGSSVISSPSGPSDANGIVTFTVTNTSVESVTYTATDLSDGVVINQRATVNFTPPAPLPASNFKGIRVVNKFATQKEFTDVLTWTPSSDPTVVSYRIYVNGVLERTIPALGPYRAEFKNRCDNLTYVYRLVAVSNFGVESSPLFVTLPK